MTEGSATTSISFGIPLASAPTPVYVPEGTTTLPAGCTGSVEAPGAEPGFLCVFAGSEHNIAHNPAGEHMRICSAKSPLACLADLPGAEGTADSTGALVVATDETAGVMQSGGTWAVTAE